jgi:hypothetical protein
VSDDGKTVDLVSYVRDHAASLVLKPVTGHAGKGVVVGPWCAPGEWESAIDRSLGKTHVVQRFIEIPYRPWPVAAGSRMEWTDYQSDLCPFVWRHRAPDGYACRHFAARDVSGAFGPVWVIEDEQ